jgi:hypothetical protein
MAVGEAATAPADQVCNAIPPLRGRLGFARQHHQPIWAVSRIGDQLRVRVSTHEWY